MKILVVGDMRHQYMLGFITALTRLERFQLDLLDTGDPLRSLPGELKDHHAFYQWREVGTGLGTTLQSSLSFQKFFKQVLNSSAYDLVVFHYLRVYHLGAVFLAKRLHVKSMIALWGSDINKASTSKSITNYLSLKLCDHVICGEPNMVEILIAKGIPASKQSVCYFGTSVGQALLQRVEQLEADSYLRTADLTITIGTSASPAQQHEAILDSLTAAIPSTFRSRIKLILPMSYAGTAEYTARIEHMLVTGQWQFDVINDFISNRELADLRLSTDIYVNLQTSDSFSGSMRENMFLGNHIVYGDWLDYSFVPYPKDRFTVLDNVSGVGKSILPFIEGTATLPSRETFPWFKQTLDWNVAIKTWANVFQTTQ